MWRPIDVGYKFGAESAKNGGTRRLAVARVAASRRYTCVRRCIGVRHVGIDDRIVLPGTIESHLDRCARQYSIERQHTMDATAKNCKDPAVVFSPEMIAIDLHYILTDWHG